MKAQHYPIASIITRLVVITGTTSLTAKVPV